MSFLAGQSSTGLDPVANTVESLFQLNLQVNYVTLTVRRTGDLGYESQH